MMIKKNKDLKKYINYKQKSNMMRVAIDYTKLLCIWNK